MYICLLFVDFLSLFFLVLFFLMVQFLSFFLFFSFLSSFIPLAEFHLPKTASNLRRDITAETSLMNDLDKRLNLDIDSGGGTLEPYSKHNLNLRTNGQSEEVGSCGIVGSQLGATGNHHNSWLLHAGFPGRTATSKTASDAGTPSRSGIPSRHWTSSKSSYAATTATSRQISNAIPKTDLPSSLHDTLTKNCATAYASVEIDKCEKILRPSVSSSSSSILGIVRRWSPVTGASGSYSPLLSSSSPASSSSQRCADKIRNRLSLRSHRCTPRSQSAHNAFAAFYDLYCTSFFFTRSHIASFFLFQISSSCFSQSRWVKLHTRN